MRGSNSVRIISRLVDGLWINRIQGPPLAQTVSRLVGAGRAWRKRQRLGQGVKDSSELIRDSNIIIWRLGLH